MSTFEVTGRPSVTLPQGTVIGIEQNENFPQTVQSFLGIPYALPPTGERRFRSPVKMPTASTIIDASKYGPIAPGRSFVVSGPKLEQSEDCLTLNVFRQTPNQEAHKLPVAVYLHGGAFNRGSASMHNTASMVAWSEEPFVAVSFNYRIGAFGFLPSTVSAQEGVLNLGLRDQVLVFEWVQENIENFGGDPGNVTLIGLSAGAHSIGHHLLNYKPGKPPLFNRVVIESGAPTSRAVRRFDAEIHELQFREFLHEVNCPVETRDSKEIFSFLRSLPSSAIIAAQETVFYKYNPSLRWAFQPVIDGDLIPRPPLETWLSGEWHKVPILTGFNENEGSLYVNKAAETSEQFTSFFKVLLPQLTAEDQTTIENLYPDPSTDVDSIYKETRTQGSLGAQYKRLEAAYGHYAYVAPVRQTANLAVAGQTAPVFVYHWALITTENGRASHGDNMRYETMNPEVLAISPTQKDLAGTYHAYITSFITKGDPNLLQGRFSHRPKWERYSLEEPKIMIFGQGNEERIGGGTGVAAQMVDDTWGKVESDFWWSRVALSQQ